MDERFFNREDIFAGEPPIAPPQISKVEDSISQNPPGPINKRIYVAHHQLSDRAEGSFPAVESGVARAPDRPIPAVLLEQEQDVVQFVLRFKIEQ